MTSPVQTVFVGMKYHDGQKALLDRLPVADKIAELVGNGLHMSEVELFARMLLTEQSASEGFRTYQQPKSRLPNRQSYFQDHLKTINDQAWVEGAGTRDIVERVGVAIALIAMNRVYGLHEADWERIEETKKKTLDFKCASTGDEFVQVEARGRSAPFSHWSAMEKEIHKKKDAAREVSPTCTAYGVVAVVPNQRGTHIEARLFDPEGPKPAREPREYRLLARHAFYARMLALVSANQLARAAQNRLAVLTRARDPFEFDGVPLVDIVGEPILTPPKDWGFAADKTLYSYDGQSSIGRVFPLPTGEFLFFGVDAMIFGIMGRQDMRALLDIGANQAALFRPDSLIENAQVSVEAMPATDMPHEKYPHSKETGNLLLTLQGPTVHMPSGIAYGRLRKVD